MTAYLTAVPAYGRDYRSKALVLADWEAGRDFRLEGYNASGYINKEDLPAGTQLNIRYDKLRKVAVIPATPGQAAGTS